MPDPKLKRVAAEIAEILKKHDLAGVILLQSEKHGEHLYHITPSWSCMTLKGDTFRFRAKREDFPSAEVQKEVVGRSVGMLAGFMDILRVAQGHFTQLVEALAAHIDFDHVTIQEGPGRDTRDHKDQKD